MSRNTNDCPGFTAPESHDPLPVVSDVVLWGVSLLFTQRTLSPVVTVRSRGANAKFTIVTLKSEGASVAVAVGTGVNVGVAVGGAGVKVGVTVFVLVGTAVGVPGAGVSVGVAVSVGVSVGGARTLTRPLIVDVVQCAEIVVRAGRVEVCENGGGFNGPRPESKPPETGTQLASACVTVCWRVFVATQAHITVSPAVTVVV